MKVVASMKFPGDEKKQTQLTNQVSDALDSE
jgi:hypothetical protein